MSHGLMVLIKDGLLPPGGLLILLVLGLLLWRRPAGRGLVAVATLALYLLSIPQTGSWLARPLEHDPSATAADIQTSGAKAILVLLAGRTHRAPELAGRDGLSGLSLQRLNHAVRLHRLTGLPLALSGGAAPRPDAEGLAALASRTLRQTYRVPALIVEDSSANTWENAQHSARLLRDRGIDKVVLVTHAWHMPRARYSAEQAGLTVITAGTGFVSAGPQQPAELSDWLPQAKALALNRNLLHEHLGLLWYRYGPRPD